MRDLGILKNRILLVLIGVFWCLLGSCEPFSDFPPREQGNHRPSFEINNSEPRFFIMSQAQKGLNELKIHQIEEFKRKMLDGTFNYDDYRQVSGQYHERSDTYFVSEGHHRLAAALEIAKEKNDWSYFKKLVHTGYWHKTNEVPRDRYPLTMRSNWLNFVGCRWWLSRLVSPRANLFSK